MLLDKGVRIFAGLLGLVVISVSASTQDYHHLTSLQALDRNAWKLPLVETKSVSLIALGEALFFEKRLSGDNSIACASCHDPNLGWADGKAFSKGFNGQTLRRSTPSILNAVYQATQMWDGRAATLLKQAMLPVEAENEMNMQIGGLAAKLSAIPKYKNLFKAAYTDGLINTFRISQALAAFEETIVSKDSRFDRWLAGDEGALSADEKSGFLLFLQNDKGACVTCHQAPNFSDDGFHNIGTVDVYGNGADLGRFEVVPVASMRGAFKTPGLRDIERTAPYFHNGSARSLEEVVDFYREGGRFKNNLSPNMRKARLNDKEKMQVVKFLQALTSTTAR